MTKLLLAILMALAAAALVAFAVANRTLVNVSFDPFDPADPAFVATMPLYLLGFAILILGALVGGLSASNQRKWRRERRRLEAELGRVRAELDRIKREAALREVRGAPSPHAGSPAASFPAARLPAS
jgi:uncharacterized integral membrane protein